MTGRRIKQGRKCSKCEKELRTWNKSGLCSHHYRMALFKRIKKERKKKHLCVDCKAKIKQITKHYAYDVRPPIKIYPLRCPSCQKRQNIYYKKRKQDPEFKKNLKQYYQRPEIKERFRLYNQKPYVKERVKQYNQRLEVKEKKKLYQREKRRKAKLTKKHNLLPLYSD